MLITPPGYLPVHTHARAQKSVWMSGWFIYTQQFVVQSLIVSDSLRPRGLRHARLPCSSPSPGVCTNLCPLSQWYHPSISSSVTLFSCPQSFPASGSFPMSRVFTSRGQRIGTSASASVLPVNIQGWFPLGLTGLIALQSKGLWRIFSNITV